MDKKFKDLMKQRLEKQKKDLESRLSEAAEKTNGNYRTKFPDYGDDEESAVNEVEDYDTKVDIDNNLVKELNATKSALRRIEKGKYGTCLNCGQEIELERLKAYPAANLCLKCEKNE